MGGGTVINGMVWNRGIVDDFNAWDSLQGGSPGWSWNDLLPYFMRVSKSAVPRVNVLIASSQKYTSRRRMLARQFSLSFVVHLCMALGE